MSSERDALLWNQFNLAEHNPDSGGGILYAIRYDTEELLAHRNVVTETLVGTGAMVLDLGQSLVGVDIAGVGKEDKSRTEVLLEELSVTSEALEYHGVGLNPDSVTGLSDRLKSMLVQAIAVGSDAYAFDFANIQIPQIVRDIEAAQGQNEVLPADEYKIVKDLGKFAATKANQIASGNIITLGG